MKNSLQSVNKGLSKIFALLVVLTFTTISAFAQPKIEIVGGDKFDWGKVKPKDSPLKTKVIVKNIGNEDLKILNVKPSCGCTAAPIDKNILKPYETATIDLSFNVGDHPGVNSKTLTITSNDPVNGTKIFRLQAEVVKPLTFSPAQYFTFPTLKVGTEAQSKITFENISGKEIKITNVKVSTSELKINLPEGKVLKAGEKFDLIGKVTPNKAGYFNCTVTMSTNHPDLSEITITGYGKVEESAVFNNK